MKADEQKKIVKEKYGEIAGKTIISQSGSCCSSNSCCSSPDYTVFSESYGKLEGYLPDADLNLGCGIPTEFAEIKPGDHVLDLGSGAGNDCFVARAIIGESGRVTGLDFTDAMLAKAEKNRKKLGYSNIAFVKGDIEEMPLPDNSFDVVVSNCVLNLVPDKHKAFREIMRVLRPGGHFCVSDVVLKGELPDKFRADAEMYAGCVSGAVEKEEYLGMIKNTGFIDIKMHKEKQIILPSGQIEDINDENESALYRTGVKGIFSITVSASKPALIPNS